MMNIIYILYIIYIYIIYIDYTIKYSVIQGSGSSGLTASLVGLGSLRSPHLLGVTTAPSTDGSSGSQHRKLKPNSQTLIYIAIIDPHSNCQWILIVTVIDPHSPFL